MSLINRSRKYCELVKKWGWREGNILYGEKYIRNLESNEKRENITDENMKEKKEGFLTRLNKPIYLSELDKNLKINKIINDNNLKIIWK